MNRKVIASVKSGAANLLLLSISLVVALVIAEFALRLLFPRYQYAAEAEYSRDSARIWSRVQNSRESYQHPDTGVPHPVFHNNLALRQHRNFLEEELASATNLAFFGDSFTENLRLPSQYSFNEPLDYLLNTSGQRFNVLNFGVDGYGTDQSFLHYQSFEYADQLDHVFYVFSANDLRNIYENNLFTLDDVGRLVHTARVESPWWIQVLSKFHLTYLVLDVQQRLEAGAEVTASRSLSETLLGEEYEAYETQLSEGYQERFHSPRADAISDSLYNEKQNEDLERSIAIVNEVLREWEAQVEANGGKFYVLVLPRDRESHASRIVSREFNIVDLYEDFASKYEAYSYDTIRFKNDGHWNEIGNLLAAVHLYRFMEPIVGIAPVADDELRESLFTYYSAFPGGWLPSGWVQETQVSPAELTSIRGKYLALEAQENGQ